MAFLEKIFTKKNENIKNNGFLVSKYQNSSAPVQAEKFSKDQIRVLLFRECDKRGRKLLFDSGSVEKVSLDSSVDKMKCHLLKASNTQRGTEFVELTNEHGYKYNKSKKDVAALGEMIFGSVAMIYKGGNSYKVHNIPSPRQIMFTTIIQAPGHCHNSTASEHSLDSSFGSSLASLDDTQINSYSDSKLYKVDNDNLYDCNGTYPSFTKISYNCDETTTNKYYLNSNNTCQQTTNSINKLHRSKKLYSFSNTNSLTELANTNDKIQDLSIQSFGDNLLCCENEATNYVNSLNKHSQSNIFLNSQNIRSHSSGSCNRSNSTTSNRSHSGSSISSLRRRVQQSTSNSLDASSYDDATIANNILKVRSKLGIAVLIDIPTPGDYDFESIIFQRIIFIESILKKLQSVVETAYLRKDCFVDMLYNGYMECQQSLYQLLKSKKSNRLMWLLLTSEDEKLHEPPNETNIMENLYQQLQENINNIGIKNAKPIRQFDPDDRCSLKTKFLHNFCELLLHYDTKDTNFFMSTLITGVLTHHLSWVQTSSSLTNHGQLVNQVRDIHAYNPLWAQVNDLSGALGSPLRVSKTIICGTEEKERIMSAVLQVLTYFIRCSAVLENSYSLDSNNDRDNVATANEVEVKVEKAISEDVAFVTNSAKKTRYGSNGYITRIDKEETKIVEDDSSSKNNVTNMYQSVKKMIMECKKQERRQPVIELAQPCIALNDKIEQPQKMNVMHVQLDSNQFKLKPPTIHNNCKNTDFVNKLQQAGKVPHYNFCNNRPTPLPQNTPSAANNKLYPNIEDIAKMECVRVTDLDNDNYKFSKISDRKDNTVFVNSIIHDKILETELNQNVLKLVRVPRQALQCHEGYDTVDSSTTSSIHDKHTSLYKQLHTAVVNDKTDNTYSGSLTSDYNRAVNKTKTDANVTFVLGEHDELVNIKKGDLQLTKSSCNDTLFDAKKMVTVKSSTIEMEPEICLTNNDEKKSIVRSNTINIPVLDFSKNYCNRIHSVSDINSTVIRNENEIMGRKTNHVLDDQQRFYVNEVLEMPRLISNSCNILDTVSSTVCGGVNQNYNSDYIIQGVLTDKSHWLKSLKRDLILSAQHKVLDSEILEAVCVIGDVSTWDVSVMSSNTFVIDHSKQSGVKVGTSQLVADMLDSLLRLYKLKLPPNFCCNHIEKKLQGIMFKAKALSELLLTTDFCSMESVTRSLGVSVDDVPLLLAVATTFSPDITKRYGLSFT